MVGTLDTPQVVLNARARLGEGPCLSTLFITSAAVGLGEDEIERSFHSGDLFALDAPVTGFAANRFSG
jgi:sugar lactone lactonase YvrE